MEEDEEATAVTSAKDPVAMPSSTPPTTLNTVLPWVVGARLESKARDTNGEHWFPVKVLEVEAGRVLVHYMNWHSRHDEWIPSKLGSGAQLVLLPLAVSPTKLQAGSFVKFTRMQSISQLEKTGSAL